MKEFIAVVLLETKNLKTASASYEETFLQVIANDCKEVEKEIFNYGKSCETEYKNNAGEKLKISFIKVIDINEVLRDKNENGNVRELYSRSYKSYN